MGNVWNKDLFDGSDIDILNEIIDKKDKQLEELRGLLEDLMNENQGYRDAVDRLNEYISNYELAIRQFNNKNSN